MLAWGDAHRGGPGGPPVRVQHPGCGATVRVELRCTEGHLVDPHTRLQTSLAPSASVPAD